MKSKKQPPNPFRIPTTKAPPLNHPIQIQSHLDLLHHLPPQPAPHPNLIPSPFFGRIKLFPIFQAKPQRHILRFRHRQQENGNVRNECETEMLTRERAMGLEVWEVALERNKMVKGLEIDNGGRLGGKMERERWGARDWRYGRLGFLV